MSRKERLVAGLMLAVAVGGGALIPRLLANSSTPLGIALGPGPRAGVVQAPTVPQAGHNSSGSTASSPSGAAATPIVHVIPATVQPTSGVGGGRPKQASGASSATPAVTVPLSPAPPVPQTPAAATRQSPVSPPPPAQAKTPPGQAKKLSGQPMTPPGQAKTPPGQAKKLQGPAPPAPTERGSESGRRNTPPDLPGSGHGRQDAQAPSHSVGPHHRGVGHLAPPSTGPAPATRTSRPQARPEDRGGRGKSGKGPSAPPPVTDDHGHKGNGKGRDG